MAGDFRLNQVINFLLTKGIKISAQNEWLDGCFTWCLESNPQANISTIQTFVYEQWLLADLRDIAERSLPLGISNAAKTTINEKYALQVDSFLDVGHSCYTQLQKIRNVSTVNLEVSETKTQTWEPKSGRMLKLTCTDGVETIFGMEYKPIAALKNPFIPGLKVLITGPIECRKGVMLLEPQNIIVLGGEIDSLIIPNAVENILARTLNLEENPNPYRNSTVADVEQQTTALPSNNYLINNNPVVSPQNDVNVLQMPPSLQPQHSWTAPAITQPTNTIPYSFDDSDDDLLLCDQVDKIERTVSQENSAEIDYNSDGSISINSNSSNNYLSLHSTTSNSNYKPPSNTTDQSKQQILGRRDTNPLIGIASPMPLTACKRSAYSPECDNKKSFKLPQITKSSFEVTSRKQLSSCSSKETSSLGYSSTFNDSRNQTTCILSATTEDSGIQSSSSKYNLSSTVMSLSPITKISNITTPTFLDITRIIYVQGCVHKLTSKPRIQGCMWKLTGIIKDDSGDLEVAFSNAFMEKIFDCSAAYMVEHKDAVQHDAALREKTGLMLKNGRNKILGMTGKIKVQFSSSYPLPQILDILT